MAVATSGDAQVKKRKRNEKSFEELEVDVNAPEPPSKRAVRRQKKRQSDLDPQEDDAGPEHSTHSGSSKHPNAQELGDPGETSKETEHAEVVKRSQYGVWIGNLPWTATKAHVRDFLVKPGAIPSEEITRIHLPTTKRAAGSQNKGFVYVDFASQDCVAAALSLSDTLLSGRRVLIKDAKNFEGRPEKSSTAVGKQPNRRVYIGNLDFDVTESELRSHFSKCGDIASIFIATFEDSGRCKGYGWITFEDLRAAESSVRGWVDLERPVGEARRDVEVKKWWLHRMNGRKIQVEYAEDSATRYKKRFGKKDGDQQPKGSDEEQNPAETHMKSSARLEKGEQREPESVARRMSRVLPSSVSSTAPTVAQRLTGAIIESKGKKIALT